jgi:surface-anchored protein
LQGLLFYYHHCFGDDPMSYCLKRTIPTTLAAIFTAILLGVSPNAAQATPVYTDGHCDLCADYDAAEQSLELHYHFHEIGPGYDEDGNVLVGEIQPSALLTRVPDIAKTTIPSGYSFLGAAVGADVWILPQTQVAGVPFLGFGTEELDDDDWSTGITYTLISATGPGEMSMWMTNPFGSSIVYWATSNGIDDGEGHYTDVYTSSIPAHSHANWAFTAEGVYEIQMQISGVLADGTTLVESEIMTFTFLVGNATAVPEPGTVAILASGALCLALRTWRRRRVTR